MMRISEVVMEAKYKRVITLRDASGIDASEGREGFSTRVEKSVVFTVVKLHKGRFDSNEIVVAVGLPSMAFGIKPGEYAGQKEYTLYFRFDKKQKRYLLIGAEWKPKEFK